MLGVPDFGLNNIGKRGKTALLGQSLKGGKVFEYLKQKIQKVFGKFCELAGPTHPPYVSKDGGPGWGIKALGALARVSPTALKKQNFLPARWRRARMRSPAAGFFLANIFLDFSAEEFRRCSLRRSALGERRGEFRCRKLKH